MNKISDYIGDYYREKGFNCAETVLCAANDAWDLHLEPAVIRTMGGFGGGMGTRNVCGAVSGGIAALSCRYVEVTGHQSPLLMAKVRLFMNTVKERLGDEKCAFLGPKYRSESEGCLTTIRLVAEILDEIELVELDEPAHRARRIKLGKLNAVLGDPNWVVVDTRRGSVVPEKGTPCSAVFSADLLEGELSGINMLLREKGICPEKNIVLCDLEVKDACAVTEYLRAKGYEKLYYFNLKLWEKA